VSKVAGIVAAVWMLFAAVVYVPDVGRGFVKDDFAWVQAGRAGLASFTTIVHPAAPGFFRPVVTASFVADYAWHGTEPRGFGVTNFFLYCLCAVAIALLLRQVGLSIEATAIGAFAWAVNPHGINMAVLWISGRTSLLLTLWSTLAAVAFLRRHRSAGALLVFLAALSKEEAVGLPVMIVALLVVCRPLPRRAISADAGAMLAAIVIYLVLRVQTPAFVPATAPWYYQPATDLRLLMTNALEYLDRGATIMAGLVVVLAAVCWTLPRLERREWRLAAAAAVWFAGGYALTVFVPVRSDLYAVFPSIGSALALGVAVDALRRAAPSFDRRVPIVLASVLLFVPVYKERNGRWVEPARLSAQAMAAVRGDAPSFPSAGTIVFEDEAGSRASFQSALGGLAGDAVRLSTGRPLDGYVIAADADHARASNLAASSPPEGPVIARYHVVDGSVRRAR
jgi:hypothetical protein